MTDFCHITPTAYLDDFAKGRPHHLVLAHLVEQDEKYADWYGSLAEDQSATIILDNSAFEMYKQGRPMYPSNQLVEMGLRVKADYVVMSDYPGEPGIKTIDAAEKLAPKFKDAGFGTFFVPQSSVGDMEDLVEGFLWASESELVDYIGMSILAVPNAYGVERGNKLQRFLSRWHMTQILNETDFIENTIVNNKKIHFLGMVDGPNEIALVKPWLPLIDTWDSSAAVWAGLNGVSFDTSPTGLVDGKFELEVDFDFDLAYNGETEQENLGRLALAHDNVNFIDRQIKHYFEQIKTSGTTNV